jgi:hypothetical protein
MTDEGALIWWIIMIGLVATGNFVPALVVFILGIIFANS